MRMTFEENGFLCEPWLNINLHTWQEEVDGFTTARSLHSASFLFIPGDLKPLKLQFNMTEILVSAFVNAV